MTSVPEIEPIASETAIIDVVIPVFKGLDLFKACLTAVQTDSQNRRFEVIVIDDGNDETEMADCLTELLEAKNNIIVLRNDRNIGFVDSVNRGMRIHPKRDVILLNSDTIVSNNWVDRLFACAYHDERVGTVSPFSNNATICSFPVSCVSNELPYGWSVASLDRVFSTVNEGRSVEIPTSVGFCMYIKRACLDDVGLFDDKSFGRGYGEETDFCLRAARKGWRHCLSADTFVYHVGGVGFGAERNSRVEAAAGVIERRYPDYSKRLYHFIKKDPLHPFRLVAELEMVRLSPRVKVLYVTHDIGGGVEKHLVELVSLLKDKCDSIVLRPWDHHSVTVSFSLNRERKDFYFSLPADYEDLLRLCRYLRVRHVHFHHLMGLHEGVWNIAKDLGLPFDVTIHDYYLINRNVVNLEQRSVNAEHLMSESAHEPDAPGSCQSSHRTSWEQCVLSLLYGAYRVFIPSQFTADIFCRYFSKLKPMVVFHSDWEQDFPYPSPGPAMISAAEPLRIAVMGALSKEKGADMLEDCALLSKKIRAPLHFFLIGYAYRRLHQTVFQHGRYDDNDLSVILDTIKPHLVWFPARCNETYSYTLSQALRSALPIVVPNIGAFPERVAGRPFTWVESWDNSSKEWVSFFTSLRHKLLNAEKGLGSSRWDQLRPNCFSYAGDYWVDLEPNDLPDEPTPGHVWVSDHSYRNRIPTTKERIVRGKETVLLILFKIRLNPVVAKLMSFVPYTVQQRVKRWFSRRPMHEIVGSG